jgi:hypothetical protein
VLNVRIKSSPPVKTRAQGHGAMTGIHTPSYTLINDTGYTIYCPECVTRSGDKRELVGKVRELKSRVCEPCKEARVGSEWKRYHD